MNSLHTKKLTFAYGRVTDNHVWPFITKRIATAAIFGQAKCQFWWPRPDLVLSYNADTEGI